MGVRNGAPLETGFAPPVGSATRRKAINVWVIALVLVVLYSGLSFYSGTFLPFRVVSGDSMKPTLGTGDIVLLKSVSFGKVKNGDIIAYTSPNPEVSHPQGKPHTILHRVVGFDVINGKRVINTKGDNDDPDPWAVTSGLLQGKMALRIPLSSWSLSFLTGLGGLALASISAIVITLTIYAGSFSKSGLRLNVWERIRDAKGRRRVASMASSLRMNRFVPGTDNIGQATFDRIRKAASGKSKRNLIDTALGDSSPFEAPVPSVSVESSADAIPLGPATKSDPDAPYQVRDVGVSAVVEQPEDVSADSIGEWYVDVNQTWATNFFLVSGQSMPPKVGYPYLAVNQMWSANQTRVKLEQRRPASESAEHSTEDDSIRRLAESVIGYTHNIEEHRAAMEDLAAVAQMLEDAVNQQSEKLEIPTSMKLPSDQAPDDDRAGVLV